MPLRPLSRGSAFEVLAYAASSANCQVEAYFDGLDERNRKRVLALLDRAAKAGPPWNQEKCRRVEGERFWEFKAYQERIFWCYGPDRQIVLLYGFTKKSNKTPKRELDTGRQAYDGAQQELSLGGGRGE